MARAKVRFIPNDAGMQEVLSWPSTSQTVEGYAYGLAAKAKANAGDPAAEFSVVSFQGVATSRRYGTSKRARSHVATANVPAMLAEARDRALLRALRGGQGR